jgi:hypothetical protein
MYFSLVFQVTTTRLKLDARVRERATQHTYLLHSFNFHLENIFTRAHPELWR